VGVFTVGATVPIALLMGGGLRFWRVGKVLQSPVIGVVLLMLAVWVVNSCARRPVVQVLPAPADQLGVDQIGYGFSSVLPV
jgi:carbon starvation protein